MLVSLEFISNTAVNNEVKKRKKCDDDNMIRAQWLITIGQKWHKSDDIELKNRIEIVQR